MNVSTFFAAVFGFSASTMSVAAFEQTALFASSVDAASLPPHKVTPAGLYLSSFDAHAVLSKAPEILFIEVRDPGEVSISGHPVPVDAIVPVMILTPKKDPDTGAYMLADNPDFLAAMRQVATKLGHKRTDPIIITCGSGRRSAMAVRRLNMAGYPNVWHIVDGYPGDDKQGMNVANAWEMAGLPWTRTAIVPGSAWDSLFPTE